VKLHRLFLAPALSLALLLGLAGCPEPEPSGSEDDPLAEATVVGANGGFSFSPDDVTIRVGGTVTFEVGSSHTATEVEEADWEAETGIPKDGGFRVDFGGTETITFDTPGTYWYCCEPHAGSGMKGKITVVEDETS
jgi:plastocyanin